MKHLCLAAVLVTLLLFRTRPSRRDVAESDRSRGQSRRVASRLHEESPGRLSGASACEPGRGNQQTGQASVRHQHEHGLHRLGALRHACPDPWQARGGNQPVLRVGQVRRVGQSQVRVQSLRRQLHAHVWAHESSHRSDERAAVAESPGEFRKGIVGGRQGEQQARRSEAGRLGHGGFREPSPGEQIVRLARRAVPPEHPGVCEPEVRRRLDAGGAV